VDQQARQRGGRSLNSPPRCLIQLDRLRLLEFQSEAQVIERANATPYGLAAYLFSRDIDRAFRVADALEVGMVGINRGVISNAAAPFGGVKQSGLGREGGHEGVEAYTETKYLSLST
jgi:succinate-semialdehyde dehydrogenase / glutarate-semialdehyde dehydrogenase